MAFIRLRKLLSIPSSKFAEGFYHRWMLDIIKYFSECVKIILCFALLKCFIILIDFYMFNFTHWNTWSLCIIFFIFYWTWFAGVLLRIFVPIFISNACQFYFL